MREAGRRGWAGLAVAALCLTGGIGVAYGLLAVPSGVAIPDREDPLASVRIQHVVAQLVLRQGGLSVSDEPLVAHAADLSSFLSRHLAAQGVPLRPVRVRIEDGWIELTGTTSPRRLLAARATSLPGVPAALLDLEVWVTVRGGVRRAGRRLDLVPDRLWVGRQPVPASWVGWLLGARADQALTWRPPAVVQEIELRPGRIVLHTAAGPGRS
jgi:hypothetical protein